MHSHAEGEGECLCNNLLRAVRYAKNSRITVFTSKLVPTVIQPFFCLVPRLNIFPKPFLMVNLSPQLRKTCSVVEQAFFFCICDLSSFEIFHRGRA
jgi:hypothetical protein